MVAGKLAHHLPSSKGGEQEMAARGPVRTGQVAPRAIKQAYLATASASLGLLEGPNRLKLLRDPKQQNHIKADGSQHFTGCRQAAGATIGHGAAAATDAT